MRQRKREASSAVALRALGEGFLAHPGNGALREALRDGVLSTDAFHGALVRLTFQLGVAYALEARGLLHPEGTGEAERALYARCHAVGRLRGAPGAPGDAAWDGTKSVLRGLATGEPRLGLPALGGLFSEGQDAWLEVSRLESTALQAVVSSLARAGLDGAGPEGLGGLYEQLLELSPHVTPDGGTYSLLPGGLKRRSSGSYYTPAALVQALLEGALEPVIAETLEAHPGGEAEALLGLALVDPACGTGHILLAAARRLAAYVSRWAGWGPQRAVQEVIRRCVHGVDLDPLAVALCKVALWLEAAEPGRPLGVFDDQVQHGNALLDGAGRFPAVMARGGFDVVLGNPPWIAHAGRAAQPLPPELKRTYARRYDAFSGYPTTHGLFTASMPEWLREGGRLGLVLPSSLSELRGYGPTRRAHDRLCDFDGEVTDFGEGRFPGVTQPCMALVSRRAAGGRKDVPHGKPWPVARPDLTMLDRQLLQKLAALPTLPASLFGERGLQSDRELAAHFVEAARPTGRFTVPLREGADVRAFELLPPRLHADREALGGRLRTEAEFQAVHVLVRQTARFPIAALSDGGAFRNSLLASFESAEWPAAALVALLNSALVRWHHFMRFRDARQPVLPQVKIGHLRAIPAPPGGFGGQIKELASLGKAMTEGRGSAPGGPLEDSLDALLADRYRLGEDEARAVRSWHAQHRPLPR